ncbi:MAG TPA: hypothetical protein VFZ35_07370 [Sphingomicrobium sp.]
MTEARPGRIQLLFELLGAAAVLAGLAALIRFYAVYGYLPAPFVFDTQDTFMDWFHTAYWAHNEGAYTVWRSIYLPLSFVITSLFSDPRCYATNAFDARDCDLVSVAFLVLTWLACVVASGIAFWRNDPKSAPYRTVAVAAGGSLLFALERGNLIMLGYLAFVLIFGGLVRTRGAIAATAGFLINMKVYLLLPVLMLGIKRDWRLLELCGFAALGLYLLSVVIVGSGSPIEIAGNLQNWFGTFAISIWDQIVYSTTYAPYLLFDVLQYPIRDFLDQRTVDLVKQVIAVEVLASRAIALLCIFCAWFYPQAISLNRLVFFVLMQSFLTTNPGGYAICLVVFVLFLEKRANFATGLAIFCCYLVSVPMDYPIATVLEVNRTSWLSGQMVNVDYVLTVGTLARPLLFVVMLWSLAIDSLIDIHRAVKAGPPMLSLSGRRWGEPLPPRAVPA